MKLVLEDILPQFFFFNAMLIKEKPGSDIKGVPASETKAISSSSFKFSIILGAFLFSL